MLFFCCCSNRYNGVEIISESDFKQTLKLMEERKPVEEILYIRNFFVQDSFLIVNNSSKKDSIFMIFDINTFKCLSSWGIRGRGPGEYGTFTHLLDISANKFQIADFSHFNIQTYSIPEFVIVEEQQIVNGRQESGSKEVPQKIVTHNGSIYFYSNIIKEELFLTKWENNSDPVVVNQFNAFKELYNTPYAYMGCLAVNENKNRLVYAYNYIRKFDIMNLQGEIIKTVEIEPAPSAPIENGNQFDIENSTICYKDIRASEKSFFLYYVGYSPTQIYFDSLPLTCYIEEYDWEGNPIRRFGLGRYVSGFDVIKDNSTVVSFIAVDERNEDPLLILK